MKTVLYGSGGIFVYSCVVQCVMCVFLSLDQEPQTEVAAQLAQEFYNFDLPLHLVNNLVKLEFEVHKEISLNNLFSPLLYSSHCLSNVPPSLLVYLFHYMYITIPSYHPSIHFRLF